MLQKANHKEFRIEKLITRKGDRLSLKRKCYDDSFKSWINMKDWNLKIELDLSNYAPKANLEGAKGTATSTLASKTDMTSLQTKANNSDLDKPKTILVDVSKLSSVIDNRAVKKTVYDKFVIKVNAVDTKIPNSSGLVTKMQYDSSKQSLEKKAGDVEKKIPNTS